MNGWCQIAFLCLGHGAVSPSELLVEGGARQCASVVTCAAHTEVNTEAVPHKLHTLDDK